MAGLNNSSKTVLSLEEMTPLAISFMKSIEKPALIFLFGDLGSGKTTFAKECIHHVTNISTLEIPSPTYSYVNEYEYNGTAIAHFDLYRLVSIDQYYDMGFDEIIENAAITFIEWPQILQDIVTPTHSFHFLHHGSQRSYTHETH